MTEKKSKFFEQDSLVEDIELSVKSLGHKTNLENPNLSLETSSTNTELNLEKYIVKKIDIKNLNVFDICCFTVRTTNALTNRKINTLYQLTKVKNEVDFYKARVWGKQSFQEAKHCLNLLDLSYNMTDEMWDEWKSRHSNETLADIVSNSKKSINLLKDLFLYLIENFEATYVIDGDMENLRNSKLSVEFKNGVYNISSKFILSINDESVYSGFLTDYFIDQCRGGGSPFLFRSIESEDKGIAIRFNRATRFYDEYQDRKLGIELKSYAQNYYNQWVYKNRNLKYWNESQFDIYD